MGKQTRKTSARKLSSPDGPVIGDYLISRLHALGVRHVFGIPGDYVLGFYEALRKSRLQIVNTCDEQGAGFAADAYARMRGLGVVCVTYCVGGLKVANTTAEAFAEKSPVVVISGAPGVGERENNPLLHHKVREFDTQKRVFEQLTVASTVLDDPQTALQEIDRVLPPPCVTNGRSISNCRATASRAPASPTTRRAEFHGASDPVTLARSPGRSGGHDQPGQAPGHPGGRRGASLRLAKGTVASLCEKSNIPGRGHHHGQIGHRREPSVLSRRL